MATKNPADTFLLEADDLLTQIEEVALEANPDSPDPEAVNRLFRAFHTIKGSGAMFGFDAVANFTHHVETALDQVREGALQLSQQLLRLVLAAKDHIKSLLEASQTGHPGSTAEDQNLVAEFQALTGHGAVADQAKSTTTAATPNSKLESFRITFRPDPAIMACGTSPAALLNELRALGECAITARTDELPHLDQLQPDQCYLWWDISLKTGSGLNAIKDVFIFVEDGSEIKIEAVQGGTPAAAVTEPPSVPEVAVTVQSLSPVHAQSKPEVRPVAAAMAGELEKTNFRKSTAKESSVRVPSDKLDRLVNLVGELVMNQSRLTQVASNCNQAELAAPVEEIERLVSELRDNVLSIRMMPIGVTFSRYKRLVHDLAIELGKEIELVTEGEETELDKTVLDQLGDPLVHLIRNSVDHGIEPMEARLRQGKTARGTIRLTASHAGSNVIVRIQDDGKGLDAAAIRAKAVEKGQIPAETALSEKEIFNLIFLPGLSTAKQVTNVSGRGVGMDVVKRQIDSLRGSISIASEVGRGTTISLTLPLTLAIIEGLLIEIGGDRFIVPMSAVTENVELHRSERGRGNGRNVIAVRGELVPYVRLRELFEWTEGEPEIEKIVIVRHEDQRVGLVVDRVLGSHQTVIQSLGRFYRDIEVVSGATIMGDGRVALIFDIAGVTRFANAGAARARHAASNNNAVNQNKS